MCTIKCRGVEYLSDPAADIFPLMEGVALQSLADDIKKNGQREPILRCLGKILDGRSRLLACEIAGVAPLFVDMETSGRGLIDVVVSANLERRHLDESQRAMVAAKIATLRGGQHQSGQLADLPTQAEAGKRLNVGERSVRRARKVVDDGVAELVKSVDRGEVSVSAAAEVATMPRAAQLKVVAGGKSAIKAAAKAKKDAKADRKAHRTKDQKRVTTQRQKLLDQAPSTIRREADECVPCQPIQQLADDELASVGLSERRADLVSALRIYADAVRAMAGRVDDMATALEEGRSVSEASKLLKIAVTDAASSAASCAER